MRRLCAVLGGDVSASLSPRIHTAAAEALGLDVAYVPVSCPTREDFARAIDALFVLRALGANVTIPHKRAALERCDAISETARVIGAVNTLTFRDDGALFGDNTDGPGLVRVFEALGAERLARVQVLGAGGATCSARDGKADVVVDDARAAASGRPRIGAAPLGPVPGATLVVSTLPRDPGLAAEAHRAWIGDGAFVLDLAYSTPEAETPLVAGARQRGLEATDGRALLAEQGALSLAAWTGGEVSRIRAIMRSALVL
ncbi:hypothetical protein L6R52_21670 [Myxococcota bacterium]|nr:hypothetical protein [Myxococcota bacterium]